MQEAAEQERAAQEEHNQKLAEFSKLLAEAGIDPNELVDDRQAAWTEGKAKVKTKTKSKREPRPAKYGFMQDGIEATWTGQGRMPKALAEQVKAGKALEDFLL